MGVVSCGLIVGGLMKFSLKRKFILKKKFILRILPFGDTKKESSKVKKLSISVVKRKVLDIYTPFIVILSVRTPLFRSHIDTAMHFTCIIVFEVACFVY